MATPAPAPVREIGYSQAVNYNWWLYEDETTPELQWPQSISVYDAMRRTDAQISSVLEAVALLVQCTPWRVEPNGARDEVVEFVATDLGLPIVGRPVAPAPLRTRDKFSWSEHLRLALLMLPFGHAFFEQVYRVDEDGSRAHLRKLALRPSKTIERVDVAPDGGLISIKQYWTKVDEHPKPIPVDRLVAYVRKREGGNWLGTSMLRCVYKNWLLKDRLMRVQAQTIERNGMGVPLYKAAETETELQTGLGMATSWRAGEAAGSAIPFGADLVLRGVEGTLPDAEPAIRYHDEQIARAVLAHFLNLGTQTGSWALGTTFADFFTLSVQTVAESVRDVATSYVVEDLVDVNWGETELAPRLVFDQIGSQQAATAQAMKMLVDSGIVHPDEVLEESSRQQYGLPPADPATATKPTADVTGDGTPAGAATTEPDVRPGSVAAAGDVGPKGGAAPAARYEQVALDAPEPVEAKYNPGQPRIPGGEHGGEWTLSGLVKDLLKIGDKVDLDDGEHLIGSGKVDADSGGARFALTRLADGTPSWRVGFGQEGFGQRDRDSGIPAWTGNGPGEIERINAERKALRDEYDRLEAEWNEATPERRAQIDARIEVLEELETVELDDDGGTAKLDEYSIDRLTTLTTSALDEAVEQDRIENEALDELDRLEADPDADPARIAELRLIGRLDNNAPGYGGLTFAEGVIPGSAWGDIHYRVELDEPSSVGDYAGAYVDIGVAPKGVDVAEWGGPRDWRGKFPAREWRKVIRQIEKLRAATGPVQAAAGADTHPGGEQLKKYWLGEGAAKWSTWTELYHHLLKYLSPGMAKRTAAEWFHERFGDWPGSDTNRVRHGKSPRGHVVGPG